MTFLSKISIVCLTRTCPFRLVCIEKFPNCFLNKTRSESSVKGTLMAQLQLCFVDKDLYLLTDFKKGNGVNNSYVHCLVLAYYFQLFVERKREHSLRH